jgi:hypothetical protein
MRPELAVKLEAELDGKARERKRAKAVGIILVILILAFFFVGEETGFLDMFQNSLQR